MRHPIDVNQTELEEIAEQATELSSWLEEVTDSAIIPQKLTAVATFVLYSGLLILMDNATPASSCWIGGCVSL
ncbi:MAG: hypothetical protein KC449_20855 [Anaerolineales bacterium]|nr:hypothetical protein [Anaerolineales bacterium]